jgi:FlaA1/EpsC-like NDP-sugar epimerase
MVDEFLSAGIRIMMMPAAEEWDGTSELTHSNLKEVDIEDLLPREKIEVDMNAIGSLLQDKVILITGAAGSIGSEMVRQIAVYNPSSLVLIDQAETPMHNIRLMMARQFPAIQSHTIVSSIANKEHMEQIFATHRPDYVFHAAAYKHVPMMEDNPGIAVQNNIYGTRVIADLAVKYETKKFVMISTDKAVNPTNVMGCSKRICEIYCQSLNKAIVEGKVKGITQFVTTRFGNVLGSNGSVIPIFKEQLRKGGPITVTHPDIIRFFMLIPEACKLVLEAGTAGKGGEIFVFDMGAPVRIVDLAKRMIKLSGAQNIEIKFTGLREGEKLYEEVLNDQEQTKPTHHPKIMIASVREYDYEVAVANEDRLRDLSFTHDDMAIVKLMKEIVPEYKSKCSKYEVLDN